MLISAVARPVGVIHDANEESAAARHHGNVAQQIADVIEPNGNELFQVRPVQPVHGLQEVVGGATKAEYLSKRRWRVDAAQDAADLAAGVPGYSAGAEKPTSIIASARPPTECPWER